MAKARRLEGGRYRSVPTPSPEPTVHTPPSESDSFEQLSQKKKFNTADGFMEWAIQMSNTSSAPKTLNQLPSMSDHEHQSSHAKQHTASVVNADLDCEALEQFKASSQVKQVSMSEDDFIVLNGIKYMKVTDEHADEGSKTNLKTQHFHGQDNYKEFISELKDWPDSVGTGVQEEDQDYEEDEDCGEDQDYDGYQDYGEDQETASVGDTNNCETEWSGENADQLSTPTPFKAQPDCAPTHSLFDGKLVRVSVGPTLDAEYHVSLYAMARMCVHLDAYSLGIALEEGKQIRFFDISPKAFKMMAQRIYAELPGKGIEVPSDWSPLMIAPLYEAARYFKHTDLAQKVIGVFEVEPELCNFFHGAREIYSLRAADEEFREFFQKHINTILDDVASISSGSFTAYTGGPRIASAMEWEFKDPMLPQLLQRDLLEVMVYREFRQRLNTQDLGCIAQQYQESTLGESVREYVDNPVPGNTQNKDGISKASGQSFDKQHDSVDDSSWRAPELWDSQTGHHGWNEGKRGATSSTKEVWGAATGPVELKHAHDSFDKISERGDATDSSLFDSEECEKDLVQDVTILVTDYTQHPGGTTGIKEILSILEELETTIWVASPHPDCHKIIQFNDEESALEGMDRLRASGFWSATTDDWGVSKCANWAKDSDIAGRNFVCCVKEWKILRDFQSTLASTSTTGELGASATAVRDSNDWDCSIKFKLGDRLHNVTVLDVPPRSTILSNVPSSVLEGSYKGVFGTFPVTYVAFDSEGLPEEDGDSIEAEDRWDHAQYSSDCISNEW